MAAMFPCVNMLYAQVGLVIECVKFHNALAAPVFACLIFHTL